jgi:alkylhydroperoxidase family enzyme
MQTSSVAASFKQGITTDSSIPEAEFAATRAVSLVECSFCVSMLMA